MAPGTGRCSNFFQGRRQRRGPDSCTWFSRLNTSRPSSDVLTSRAVQERGLLPRRRNSQLDNRGTCEQAVLAVLFAPMSLTTTTCGKGFFHASLILGHLTTRRAPCKRTGLSKKPLYPRIGLKKKSLDMAALISGRTQFIDYAR